MKLKARMFFCFMGFLNWDVKILSAQEDKIVIGAIGDSITAGFNAEKFSDNRGYSWSTGDKDEEKVDSHYFRVKENNQTKKIVTKNMAFVGAEAKDLLLQTRGLKNIHPNYVTVLIGANDVCHWQEDHAQELKGFKSDVGATIREVIKMKPDVKITLLPIPNFKKLYELGKSHGCQQRWNLISMCSPLLSQSVTEEKREKFYERWEDANDSLREVASEFDQNVLFIEDLKNYAFEWEHISPKDCFHPSVEGQNQIAELAWDATWVWF